MELFLGDKDMVLEMTNLELEEIEDHPILMTVILIRSSTLRVPEVPILTRWTPAEIVTGAEMKVDPRRIP